ncbi:MAG: LysR family transcriptional regulator [Deltaproteobacteria bacterium]|jgi:DNA-binding transcriptional LysR family regulator
MRIYARVAELKSFTQAAESLGLPKATVSHAVQALEARLGVQLLHRTTRRVRVTPDGAAYYERVKDLLFDFDELEQTFSNPDQPLKGRIRVDMPSRMARLTVIPRLPEFLALHPEITVELGATDRMVDLVREGYDCVVRVGELSSSGLVAKRIGEMPLVNCASPAYLERYGRPRRLKDLDKHQMVHFVGTLGGRPEGFWYEKDGEYVSYDVPGRVQVNNAENFVAACEAGLGIIQSPLLSIDPHLEDGRLVEVLPRLRAEPMPISLVFPQRRNLSRRVRAFMDWVTPVIQGR